MNPETECVWTHVVRYDENNNWETNCGEEFFFEEGSPAENSFRFCPYCARHLVELVIDETDEE